MPRFKPYILAYDIRCKKRLARVHKLMTQWGIPIQYSVFAVDLTPRGLERLWMALYRVVDPDEDDVRLYPAPARGTVVVGKVTEGMVLTGSAIMNILYEAQNTKPPEEEEES